MRPSTPLWPAQLDHIQIESDDPDRLASFYREAAGMGAVRISGGRTILIGPGRRLVVAPGTPGAQPWSAFRLRTPEQTRQLRRHLEEQGVPILRSPSPLFVDSGFAVRDPDGRLVVFGLPRADLPDPDHVADRPAAFRLPGRLQHVVVATADLAGTSAFYQDALGFRCSDVVRTEDGEERAVFLRSDSEHHSFAAFLAPRASADHHAYEATCWNDIRDWADNLARLEVKIWWGPGRHGPGNNLFFMFKDPHGYLVEVSAELEVMPFEAEARSWPPGERALNLWGWGFLRDSERPA